MNISLMLSGSIAAYKAGELASRLVKAGHQVQAVATEAALRFVGAATLEGLTDKPVLSDLWAAGQSMEHIKLRRWSDLYLLYPATANRLNRLAAGLADDLVGSIYLANNFEKPFWLAPAMNPAMLSHPTTKESLRVLAAAGCRVLQSDDGRLACGDYGVGRLMEPAEVFALVQAESRRLRQAAAPVAHRLLLTGGAMTEDIDRVRFVQNRSSGRTASAIAARFLDSGWQVDYLHHQDADLAGSDGARYFSYRGFADLEKLLSARFKADDYAAVVHAAAVSDYAVEIAGQSPQAKPVAKLDSHDPINLTLRPNPKLLTAIRKQTRGRGQPLVCAFKLTVGQTEANGLKTARGLLEREEADLVVWNDLSRYTGDDHYYAVVGTYSNKLLASGQTTDGLAKELFAIIDSRVAVSKAKQVKEKDHE